MDFHSESLAQASLAADRLRDSGKIPFEKTFSKIVKIHTKAMHDIEQRMARAQERERRL
jgi:hypothetical protein